MGLFLIAGEVTDCCCWPVIQQLPSLGQNASESMSSQNMANIPFIHSPSHSFNTWPFEFSGFSLSLFSLSSSSCCSSFSSSSSIGSGVVVVVVWAVGVFLCFTGLF